MSFQEIRSSLQEYAKDIKINLGNVLSEEGSNSLKQNQIYAIALASALTTRNKELIEALSAQAEEVITSDEIYAVKAAVTIMAMNNIYYRSIHFLGDKEYLQKPAGLRMNVMRKHKVDQVDFELYSLAVSVINGCEFCVNSHAKIVAKKGISADGILSTIRISSVINATAQAMEIN